MKLLPCLGLCREMRVESRKEPSLGATWPGPAPRRRVRCVPSSIRTRGTLPYRVDFVLIECKAQAINSKRQGAPDKETTFTARGFSLGSLPVGVRTECRVERQVCERKRNPRVMVFVVATSKGAGGGGGGSAQYCVVGWLVTFGTIAVSEQINCNGRDLRICESTWLGLAVVSEVNPRRFVGFL